MEPNIDQKSWRCSEGARHPLRTLFFKLFLIKLKLADFEKSLNFMKHSSNLRFSPFLLKLLSTSKKVQKYAQHPLKRERNQPKNVSESIPEKDPRKGNQQTPQIGPKRVPGGTSRACRRARKVSLLRSSTPRGVRQASDVSETQ